MEPTCVCGHGQSHHMWHAGGNGKVDCGRCGCLRFTDAAIDSGRHPKWQRVEPGTVIPAGQPYRAEWSDPSGDSANERVSSFQQTAPPSPEWFIDSSWKPPLVLPTEPTWGIAIRDAGSLFLDQWSEGQRAEYVLEAASGGRLRMVRDFIPLTDEQVARIEAAR